MTTDDTPTTDKLMKLITEKYEKLDHPEFIDCVRFAYAELCQMKYEKELYSSSHEILVKFEQAKMNENNPHDIEKNTNEILDVKHRFLNRIVNRKLK